MTRNDIGVAVIGGGMAGRAHAAGYRSATTLFGTDRPDVRLVAIADTNKAVADDAARRYGYERAEPDWRAVAEADDVDVVSVVVANHLHREIIEGLLAAGKHVLCEKPLAASYADAEAMVVAAEGADTVSGIGYTFRRTPAINAIRRELAAGNLGDVHHFNGRYWTDYGLNPAAPITWRYRGGPGTGALADIGSHLVDVAEYLCGPLETVSGATFATTISERPVPAGATVGHQLAEVTGELAPVENEDVATFTAQFAGGAAGTFSVSRVAHCLPNGLGFELFASDGSAGWDLHRAAEFSISDRSPSGEVNGARQVIVGPEHPYVAEGLPMSAGGVGHGVAELFAYQARAFLDQVAGVDGGLPACASFAEGLRGLRITAAIAESARIGGATVKIN